MVESRIENGQTFMFGNWRYTVLRESVLKPDSMVYCKCEHTDDLLKPRYIDVWIDDLLGTL